MNATSKRAKDRRVFRWEALEDRNLLSAMEPHVGSIVAEVVRTPAPVSVIRGRVTVFPAGSGLYTPVFAGDSSFSGHGQANSVGYVNLGAEHVQTAQGTTLTIANGRGVLNTARGDQITVIYSGHGVSSRGRVQETLSGTVTGGTGRFLAATGTFGATATGNPGRLTVSFTIILSQPR